MLFESSLEFCAYVSTIIVVIYLFLNSLILKLTIIEFYVIQLDDSVLCRIYKNTEKESKSNEKSTQALAQDDQEVPNSTSSPQNEPMEYFEFKDPMAQMIYDHDYMLQSDQNAPRLLVHYWKFLKTVTLLLSLTCLGSMIHFKQWAVIFLRLLSRAINKVSVFLL